jgi:hypothetical protein
MKAGVLEFSRKGNEAETRRGLGSEGGTSGRNEWGKKEEGARKGILTWECIRRCKQCMDQRPPVPKRERKRTRSPASRATSPSPMSINDEKIKLLR